MREQAIYDFMQRRLRGIEPAPLPTATTYLQPDVQPGHVPGKPGHWTAHIPSMASRRPPARSQGHSRGSIIDSEDREHVYESQIERGVAYILAADRRVAAIFDQPQPCRYVTPDGKSHRHTLDYLAVQTDGTRVAIAVKPSRRVEKSRICETLDLIEHQTQGQVADRFLVRTEQHASADRVFNARYIIRARRARNASHVEWVASVAADLKGAITIENLIARCDLPQAYTRNAVVNLIDEGVLELVGNVRIGNTAKVRLAGGVR